MLGVSLLSKAAAIALLAGITYAHPAANFLQRPIGTPNNALNHHPEPGLTQHHCETLSSEAQDRDKFADTWLSSSHPGLADHSMRYKTPDGICDSSVKQISGYLDVETDKHFFFWFFESRHNPKEDPLILWVDGGPGCSSMVGLLTEYGPCLIDEETGNTTLNKYSWNNNASVIFLDQPLNVGYSYGKGSALDSVAAAQDVYSFLQLFFKEFPEYSSLDFHVAGESYGGHFVPAIAGEINRNNKAISISSSSMESGLTTINLNSILIGNGMTSPLIQYQYYSKYACGNSYGEFLDQETCDQMDDNYSACAKLIENCYASQDKASCMPAFLQCNKEIPELYRAQGKNLYDVRKECIGKMCFEIVDTMEAYLNRPEVLKALGAQVDKFESCNDDLGFEFSIRDWMRPYVNEIPVLLEDDIRVLIYAGDADFICNWMGNQAWMMELPWSGHDEFATAKDTDWFSTTANEQGGELRTTKDGRFAFLRVFGSGHLVGMDHGDYAIDMLNSWLQGILV
ncbi:peptidase S10, serine carboxypeptidase [Lichtheimia hyalospora FSU 10163]|nr:peptidase S10, serine carboxypeptidase [Lichtheimia hyalospora FSU 10163]